MTRGTQPSLRFRTRKLSPKQPLPVLREDQIESSEYKELLENQYKVETGVEKSEENVSLLFLYTYPSCHVINSCLARLRPYGVMLSMPLTCTSCCSIIAQMRLMNRHLLCLGIPSPAGASSGAREG